MKYYQFTLNSDIGEVVINRQANNLVEAIEAILNSELAPERAIKKIEVKGEI